MFPAQNFFRSLRYRIRQNERLLTIKARANPYGLLSKMATAKVLAFDVQTISRGLAVGLFWCFVPVPLQMIPAALFCWLGRANLPIAFVCVWISNPFTYVPIFYFEYKVGQWFFVHGNDVTLEDFTRHLRNGDMWDASWQFLSHIVRPLMQGALLISTLMAVVGYVLGLLLFRFLKRKKLHAAHSR